MAGILISPSTEKKIRSRNAALRLRQGLPVFKDVLRQRFRRRIRESRSKFVDKIRDTDGLQVALKKELSDIISMMEFEREEQMDVAIEEFGDGLSEHEEWILHQYNTLLSDDEVLQQLYEESLQVVCPICFKGILQTLSCSNVIQCCSCSLRLPPRASLQEVSVHLHHCVDAHDDSGCTEPLRFFLSEEDTFVYLYAICSTCSFLNLVV